MRIYEPADSADRFPQGMVEATTEFDWSELPDVLKDVMRHAAREFAHWAENQHSPISGEPANEIEPTK